MLLIMSYKMLNRIFPFESHSHFYFYKKPSVCMQKGLPGFFLAISVCALHSTFTSKSFVSPILESHDTLNYVNKIEFCIICHAFWIFTNQEDSIRYPL